MLKITSPIGIVNKNIISGKVSGLCERINENYQIINTEINSEDLLHIFNEPPQVFLSEGEVTNVFNSNINVSNIQERKLSVLNNLINRILISDQSDFTYQDKVYISTILKKLGINDEHTFLSQINEFIDETKLTYAQNQILSKSVNELKAITNNIANKGTDQRVAESDEKAEYGNESVYHLHSDVFNRLNVAEMTSFINQITHRPFDEVNISSTQIIGAESLRIADHITLQNYHNQIKNSNIPLIYNHENYYEENIDLGDEVTEEKISVNLAKAMLTGYIDNLYQTKIANYFEGSDRFYDNRRSFYGSVENVVKRYTQNLTAPISNQILMDFHESEITNYTNMLSSINQIMEQAGTVFLQHNEINTVTNTKEGQDNHYYNQNSENLSTNTTNNISNIENVDLTHVENIDSYLESVTMNEEEIQIALQKVEQRNIENRNQYIRALQNLQKKSNAEVVKKSGKDRQKAESLMALNDPEQLIFNYQNEIIEEAKNTEAAKEEAMKALPGEVRKYFEIIDKFLVNPTPESRKLMGADAMALLNSDINEVMMQHREVPTSEQTVLNESEAVSIIENVTKTSRIQKNIEERVDEEIKKVEFIHKENSNVIDEEEINQRFEELRKSNTETKVITNEINHTTTEVNTTQIKHEVINEVISSDRIVKMVSENVSDQLNSLSDQVYKKLEKKLINEKRRRGL